MELPAISREIRKEVVRMLAQSGSGHPGGSLSAADIVTCLFFHTLRHDPKNPQWEERDRFILSKGHACPVVYAAMAISGYFPKELLGTLRKLGSPLQGHPDTRFMPALEACTGSLGQGLSIAAGLALGIQMSAKGGSASGGDKPDHRRVYCLMSDGENEEGQTWEAAGFAGFHKLDRLIAILDYNKYQLDGAIKDILDLEPLRDKWESFRWNVQEVDGHDLSQILPALEKAKAHRGQPSMIIAHTVKGKGVSFMENNNYFHGVAPTLEEAQAALQELDGDPSLSRALVAAGKIKKGAK
jgi:transketolase